MPKRKRDDKDPVEPPKKSRTSQRGGSKGDKGGKPQATPGGSGSGSRLGKQQTTPSSMVTYPSSPTKWKTVRSICPAVLCWSQLRLRYIDRNGQVSVDLQYR